MYSDFIQLVKRLYHDRDIIGLHAPLFIGNEKKYQQLEKDIIKNKFKGKYLIYGKSSLGKTSFINVFSGQLIK